MSTEALLPDFPTLAYAETPTGGTVRGGHTITRAVAANIVALGRPARRIGPVQGQSNTTSTYVVGYVRSHADINQLRLAWYFHADFTNTPATHSLDLTITDAAGHSVASSSTAVPIGFKGETVSAVLSTTPLDTTVVLGAEGYLDLDVLAATLTDPSWSFKFVYTASNTHVPLDRIEGWECPRSQVDSADAYGLLTGPENPGNPIVAGSTTTYGYERLAKTIEGGIACNRTVLSVAWPTDTSIAPGTASATYTAFTRMLESGTTPWPWKVRPRVVYHPSSAAGETHRARIHYKVTGSGTANARVSTGATGSPYTIGGLTSATWAWSDWTTIEIPTNGTDRIASITFEGKTSAGTFYVAGIEVEENNT